MTTDTVTQFYEKCDGSFGLVNVLKKDKKSVDNLVRLLIDMKVHVPINKEELMNTWKQYDRTNVRWFMSKP